ncbi:S8 family serine peptidase [Bermanella sp. WJH001]|uniref:S8 family serine peptidase n=1 Tax=Bermanella sp. WJH001 TaxID=3048005 RepID=UPI0024BEF9C2|nr:S8 family serine peptidase [Bermanella sp. WJH001]MDJ1537926.1 S8 family serine peptidase [Bermanella sp. WJH001]
MFSHGSNYLWSFGRHSIFILLSSMLVACGSDSVEPEPRVIKVDDIVTSLQEDDLLVSSVNQNLGSDVLYYVSGLPQNGTLELQVTGEFEYSPNQDFYGVDSFYFNAQSEGLSSNIGKVEINVSPVNDAPTSKDVTLITYGLSPVSIELTGLDVDGDTLQYSLASDSLYGDVTLSESGLFSYTPSAVFTGQDTVKYRVSDGQLISESVIDINVTESAVRFTSVVSELTIQQRSIQTYGVDIENLSSEGKFVALSSSPSWASASFSEEIPGNDSKTVSFSIDAANLDLGYYSGMFQVMDYSTNTNIYHHLALNVVQDFTPPAEINDLSVTPGVLFDEARLAWTSISDNQREEIPADIYEIRYFNESITDDNWALATPLDGVPAPALPGTEEEFLVSGLNAEQEYFFAVKSQDLTGNKSDISNVASFTTPSAPLPELAPESASISLSEGQSERLEVVLRNNGATPLEYSARVALPQTDSSLSLSQLKVYKEQKINMPLFHAVDIAASNNIIIKKKSSNTSSLVVGNAIHKHGLKIKKRFDKLNMDVLSISGKTQKEIATLLNELNSLPEVLYAEPDYLVSIDSIPNDASFTQQWAVNNEQQTGGVFDADIDAVEAWGRTTDGSNVVVAVIDTGVNYNHSDLANNIWTNTDEIPGNGIDDDANGFIDDVHGYDFVNNDGDPMDDNDHGTHCAGIIGAEGDNGIGIAGTVHTAQIMAVKFLSASGGGQASDAIESILYAVDNGANILNNSWGGGGFSQGILDAIEYANQRDVLFVAAAGNSSVNTDNSPNYPSGYDTQNMLAVASTTHADALSNFSNYGVTTVDLGAPGSDILSTVSNGGYDSFSGTSMATPYVAGAAVMIRSNYPSLSAIEVKQILMDTVDLVPSLNGKTVTGGRLNLDSAMLRADELSYSFVVVDDNATGIVPPEGEVVVPVVIDAFGQIPDNYNVQINFDVNNPVTPQLSFDLNIEVLPDEQAPNAINDLSVSESSSTNVLLSWTNTGDDGLVGRASEVQIAYSQEPITIENWDAAIKISGITPNLSGETQEAVVTGLFPNTTYYFAARVIDNSAQISDLSNTLSVLTAMGPILSVAPQSIDVVTLLPDETSLINLLIGNAGDERLEYRAELVSAASAPVVAKLNAKGLDLSESISKGQVDTRQGEVVINGTGGPDAYGYTWSDSNEGVAYVWQDIVNTGTSFTLSDDNVVGPYNLGFEFEFYGESYNQIWVSSNGFVSFGAIDHGCCSGQPIPSADGFNNIIAWAWDDLYPTAGYTAHYLSTSEQFIVQFTNYGEFGDSGSITAQVILSKNGRIRLQYQSINNNFDISRLSIGIENANGTDGLQVAFNSPYIENELAIEFSQSLDWVSLSQPTSGIDAGFEEALEIVFDSTDQVFGTYEAELHILSNDGSQPEVVIPLRMDVVEPL